MSRSDDPEIPTSTDAMLRRTRRRADQLRRRRRLVIGGAATAVVAVAIALPLVLSDHPSTHVVNVVGGTSAPSTVGPVAPTAGPTTTAPPPASSPTLTTPTAPPASTTTPTTAGARGLGPAGSGVAPACATAELRASLTGGNGAAGSVGYQLTLRNIGSGACRLSGYPGVSYVTGASGPIVGAPAQRDHVAPAATVTIAPQHAAQATLVETDALDYPTTTCRLSRVAGLRIYPPNQTASLFVAQPGRDCANASDPGLQIGPMEVAPATGT
jgi:hypothetical protein